ncbi:PREDICTED: brain-specific angiogenesis inhibitor 1-associated protein 2-like protein 2 isoform X1 [Poecilia mexicana]|uniref:brain-specific angiogenesis inhibitor 1-associated protein 2-like protein 2 isoform X1 n=1 Tax=Poecilia mexicana TaxID=48701 RepID=UPI00072E0017|nr:PREDICTED: brain-specific angiogenesis inhibitor 1-associated protein 2-like protein 2 isoform X1 [Poecilia mexicana]
MSGINGDQLHRSTLGIYSSLTDELNPSLQKLLSLGNHFARAFRDLVVSSEAYFTALSKIGEKAFYSSSSRSLGDVLIQIADSQRRLTKELEGVFRNFSVEVLQVMESSVQMDFDYISHSRVTYEREVHKQAAAAQQRQRRGGTGQVCLFSFPLFFSTGAKRFPMSLLLGLMHICTVHPQEYLQFLKESHQEALQEEDRRYRFLAEKHCGLVQSLGLIMNKMSGPLLQKTDVWTEEVDATRRAELQRPAAVDNTGGMRAEDIRQIREEMTLGKIPSRAPSPVGSIYRSRGGGGGGGGGAVTMRAKAPHQPSGSNPTLLPFSKGQIITVKSRQPRNGWLYGYAENGSGQGWFPASYVEELDDPPMSSSSWNYTLRSGSSMSDLLDQPGVSSSSSRTSSAMSSMFDLPKPSSSSSSRSGAPPPPPPPPTQSSSKSQSGRSQNELFPRGTNPFATVKLKPTHTNDRSAPILYRR